MERNVGNTTHKPRVRLIGGPECQLAFDADLLRVPFTLEGLSRLTNLCDAEIIVYWPDPGLFDATRVLQELCAAGELLKDDKVEAVWGFPVLTVESRAEDKETGKVSVAEGARLLHAGSDRDTSCGELIRIINNHLVFVGRHGVDSTTWGEDAHRRETGYDDIPSFVRDVLCHVMADAWIAAKHGAVVFAVIPAEFVPYAYDWISPYIRIGKPSAERVFLRPIAPSSGRGKFIQAIQHHGEAIANYDKIIGLEYSKPEEGIEAQVFYKGPYTLNELTDDSSQGDMPVDVCPGLQNVKEEALTLVFNHGSGGVILTPEPTGISELLGTMISVIPAMDPQMVEAGRKAKMQIEEILKKKGRVNPLIGESPAVLCMYPEILKAYNNPAEHILVCGETGSGKEVLCNLLKNLSDQEAPFIIPQLNALSGTHLKSAVFGHVKGAYNDAVPRQGAVETAEDGTLVLDNLQFTDRDFYAEFLRFLEPKQEYQPLGSDEIKSVKCRVIACFNIQPDVLVKSGQLPPDWMRRFGIRIDIPSLNTRKDDIPLLVQVFVDEFKHDEHWPASLPDLTSMVVKWKSQSWGGAAGNVGGLRKAVRDYLMGLQTVPMGDESTARSSRGRRPGRNISDEALLSILKKVLAAPGSGVVELFDSIDEKYSPDKITRTKEALEARLRRIDRKLLAQFIGSSSSEAYKKLMIRIRALRRYRDLTR